MTRETITMLFLLIISVMVGVQHYVETQHIDFMSIVFGSLATGYFICLLYNKLKSVWASNDPE